MLRKAKVVGKFVEFFGEGAASLAVPDRATICNMAPEYGATIGFFAVDDRTVDYMAKTGRTRTRSKHSPPISRPRDSYGMPQSGRHRLLADVGVRPRLRRLQLGGTEATAGSGRILRNMKKTFDRALLKADGGQRLQSARRRSFAKRYPTKRAGCRNRQRRRAHRRRSRRAPTRRIPACCSLQACSRKRRRPRA